MGHTDLRVLESPYRDWHPLFGSPGLGSVVFGRCAPGVDLSVPLNRLLEAAPWVVPCLALTAEVVTPVLLQSFWSLPAQPAFVVLETPLVKVAPSSVTHAVASRPAPTSALLIAYVVRRTHSVLLGETLEQVWRPHRNTFADSAERTVRYRLRQQGDLSRHDWVRVRRLIRVKTEGRSLRVEQQAQLVGTEARTLRGWVARYLGVTFRTFRQTAGWEWILESALRRGGFELEGISRSIPARHPSPAVPV